MMDDISTPVEIPFQEVLDALLDVETPFPPRYLYRFSDLPPDDLASLRAIWGEIPAWRRKALLEDLEQLFVGDTLLSFEGICGLGLTDAESETRFLSVRSLMEYEVPDLIPTFGALMERDTHQDVRAAAASALGKYVFYGETDELPAKTLRQIEDRLLQVLNGDDLPQVRRRALESLGYSSRGEMAALIETAFNTRETIWMESALFAMARSADKRWISFVVPMLDHVRPTIRTEAARAAGEVEAHEAVPRLLELLDDDNDAVRAATIWSLSQLGGDGVQEALDAMLAESEDEDEITLLDNAIENLIFNQSVEFFGVMSFPEDESDLDEDDFIFDDEDRDYFDEDEYDDEDPF